MSVATPVLHGDHRDAIVAKVNAILFEHSSAEDRNMVTPQALLQDGLGFNYLRMIEVVLAINEYLNADWTNGIAFLGFETVADVHAYALSMAGEG